MYTKPSSGVFPLLGEPSLISGFIERSGISAEKELPCCVFGSGPSGEEGAVGQRSGTAHGRLEPPRTVPQRLSEEGSAGSCPAVWSAV